MKIMAIDLGTARTGLAFSDLSGFLAGRSITVTEHARSRLLEAIGKEIAAERPGRIVVGLPLNMNGTEGPKALECREFAAQLEELRTACEHESSDIKDIVARIVPTYHPQNQ